MVNTPQPGFDASAIAEALHAGRVQWRLHALTRLIERGMSRNAVLNAVRSGVRIRDYPEDKPYPSALFMGYTESNEPVHVVASWDASTGTLYIITAYYPDEDTFAADWRTRKR